jgi:hypothetical protein
MLCKLLQISESASVAGLRGMLRFSSYLSLPVEI